MVLSSPSLCGIPYKVIALVTLVVQNSMLTILLHYVSYSHTFQSSER